MRTFFVGETSDKSTVFANVFFCLIFFGESNHSCLCVPVAFAVPTKFQLLFSAESQGGCLAESLYFCDVGGIKVRRESGVEKREKLFNILLCILTL